MNYDFLAKALEYYQTLGYKYIDVPWTVSESANRVTAPEGCELYQVDDLFLVGSGEQSLIQMIMDGNLGRGRYCCLTPCFRDDIVDEYHQRYFMKVELMQLGGSPSYAAMNDMLGQAEKLFNRLSGQRVKKTSPHYVRSDLMLNGIEVGSYGLRYTSEDRWVYGTGLAEPRFSQAMVVREKL